MARKKRSSHNNITIELLPEKLYKFERYSYPLYLHLQLYRYFVL